MLREERGRNSPSYRRRSPLHDIQRVAPRSESAAGIQIKGLARERDERRAEKIERKVDQGFDERQYDERQYVERQYDERTYEDYPPRNRPSGRSHSPYRNGRHDYRDRDRESYRSPDREYISRSSSPRRRDRSPYFGGPASREVILEGLPVELTEEHASSANGRCFALQITTELTKYYKVNNLEDVRIIRDRKTGLSRQFGFLRFATIQASKAFLSRNYPTIHIYGPNNQNDQGAKVRIAFSREREDRDRIPEPRWKSDMMAGSLTQTQTSLVNTGNNDVSPDGTPSQFLVFRGLEPTVTEELLAKGATKLFRPEDAPDMVVSNGKIVSTSSVANAGARPGTIRRVMLVRDRRSHETWRYGFVEFLAVEDAQAAVAKFHSLEKFTISSKSVLVDYIHAGVFVPVLHTSPPGEMDWTVSASTNPDLRIAYWDENAYVKELQIMSERSETSDLAAKTSEKKISSKISKDGESKKKKRKAEESTDASAKKSLPDHLQFWTSRHAELHGIEAPMVVENGTNQTQKRVKAKAETDEQPLQQSFADPSKHCCYLCSRQFQTSAEANKHERLSTLHQDNLKNEDLKAKALTRLEKAGLPASGQTNGESEYRDRARERRAAFNQPKQPGFKPPTKKSSPPATSPAPMSDPVSSSTAATSSSSPVKSKGASLLGKMGWTAGSGLGAQGTGSVAPIATDMYVQGVGLGAEGGRVGDAVEEANRSTKGDYAEFAARTRDRARERFEKLGE